MLKEPEGLTHIERARLRKWNEYCAAQKRRIIEARTGLPWYMQSPCHARDWRTRG